MSVLCLINELLLLQSFAENTMNELLGWYGYDKVELRDSDNLEIGDTPQHISVLKGMEAWHTVQFCWVSVKSTCSCYCWWYHVLHKMMINFELSWTDHKNFPNADIEYARDIFCNCIKFLCSVSHCEKWDPLLFLSHKRLQTIRLSDF